MRHRHPTLAFAAAVIFSAFSLQVFSLSTPAADRSAQWSAVTDAQKASQPKTASAALDKIITSAFADAAYPEALRAILIKAQTDASVENPREQPAAVIRTLTAWLPPPGSAEFPLGTTARDAAQTTKKNLGAPSGLPPAMLPLLHAALARQWWSYHQQNRWQLLQRTQTATSPSDDFLTWDARRVLAETARHFEAALADPAALQQTPIATLEPLLAPGTLPDTYRPTLYDFLVQEAIAFYSAGDQGVSAAEDAFEPTADSPILGTLEEFLAWNAGSSGTGVPPVGSGGMGVPPMSSAHGRLARATQSTQTTNPTGETPVPLNPALRAVQLYQQLLRFHQTQTTTSPNPALADADLARLNWSASLLGNTDATRARHLAALRAFIETHARTEPAIATAACNMLASLLYVNDDPAAAVAAAQQGIDLDPDSTSNATIECRNRIAHLTAPALSSITTETTWPANPAATAPLITVNYRNQTKIYFRAYALDWEQWLDGVYFDNIPNHEKFRNRARDSALEKSWTAALPPTPDHRFRAEKLPAPRNLKPGHHLIAASLDENFSDKENIITTAGVWVSDLAIVHNNNDGKGKSITGVTGFIVNAVTGEPVAKASVSAWFDVFRNDKPFDRTTSASDGSFTLTENISLPPNVRPRILRVETAGDQFATQYTSNSPRDRSPPDTRAPSISVAFLTDRAIYRPGQIIHFKAIVVRDKTGNNDYSLMPRREITVVLDDPNCKEVGKLNLTTNGFGSASGNFTIPAGSLTGNYQLSTTNDDEDENGSADIRVEEYKRPKFEVALPAPATAPRLNDTVSLTGAASAYTGAPIDGAKVTWHVNRLVRWPAWCWWFPPVGGSPAEIAHGTTTTDSTGNYTITFTARPDTTADAKDEPIFTYIITADVTDPTGETRTATRKISIGYTALSANIIIAKGAYFTAQTPVTLEILTTTLDLEPQPATGTIALHALKQPATVPQPELERDPFNSRARGPSVRGNPSDPRNWTIEEKPIVTLPFATDAKTGRAKLTQQLPAGIYRAIVATADRFGKPVTAQTEIRVLAPESKTHPIKEPLSLTAPAWTAHPGDTLNALWSTGYAAARARISIEQDSKVLRAFWTKPGLTQQHIPIKITEAMRGGITIRVTQIRDNRLVTDSHIIDVPWDNKKLKITWEHFTSKLTPGGRETWTAKITTPDSAPATAELAATLYDASLDQFAPHNWPDFSDLSSDLWRQEDTYNILDWNFSNRIAWFGTAVDDMRQTPLKTNNNPPYRYWNYINDDTAGFRIRGMGGALRDTAASISVFTQEFINDIGARSIEDMLSYTANVEDTLDAYNIDRAEISSGANSILRDEKSNISSRRNPTPNLSAITARKNLSETAFFYPQLLTAPDGTVRIEFTAPEALTRWKFLAFAHDKQLRTALLTDTAVTAKDLMVQPNPPRFLREGDTVEFTVKVTNMTDKPQQGTAQLTFADATTLESIDLNSKDAKTQRNLQDTETQPSESLRLRAFAVQKSKSEIPFTLAPNSSQTLSWRITIPDGQGFLTYKAVASTGAVSDGEEGFLPVLSRRQLVTESIALPIRDAGTRTFRFDKLAAQSAIRTPQSEIQSESLTIQMTSNPAWYAVLALPQLMEFPHECSEQLFNRYYANALAAHIANSDPKIARVFEQWRSGTSGSGSSGTGDSPVGSGGMADSAMLSEHGRVAHATQPTQSPLLQNPDLKSILIEETPWLRAATSETENRRAIANLFDLNRTTSQADTILRTLAERQGRDGLWSWFPGGDGSEYITRYLVAGFARLRAFGIPLDKRADTMLKRAVTALDTKFAERYADLQKQKNFTPAGNYLASSDAFQLYARSFFLKEIPIPASAQPAYDYFKTQAAAYWQTLPRQSQGHVALALARMDVAQASEPARWTSDNPSPPANPQLTKSPPATPATIVTSLRQRAKNSEELGMYWSDADAGWFWWQAPIETQALMIELFDEVARDPQAVSDLQLWLLKQKQTHSWPSTKATADAVHALLLRGTDKLASDALVSVTLGDGSSGTGVSPVGSGGMGVPPMSSEHGRDARATQSSEHGRDAHATRPEPGTGFYTRRIPGPEVTPAMGGRITVTKTDPGPAWGSVTWQYFQTLDKITPHEATPLTLKKTLWKQINTASGPTLVAIDSKVAGASSSRRGEQDAPPTLNPGDTLIVRLELRTDRDMEFVHLKDQRGSGTEPANVLSGYRWKNGLGYYESTRDTATHFFIDRLPAGTHVFEYPIRVQLRGRYESGIAEIQCMYAPEYNSHSASTTLVVE